MCGSSPKLTENHGKVAQNPCALAKSHFPSTTTANAVAVPLPIFDGEEKIAPSFRE